MNDTQNDIDKADVLTLENESLKKQNLFLRLRLRSASKAYRGLRSKFDALQKHFFKGVKYVSASETSVLDEKLVSTTKYAESNGMKLADVFAILEKEGILTKVGKLVFLSNPGVHGKYAVVVRHDYGTLKRNLLYWNEDGVKFLDEVMLANGMKPKSRIDL